MNSNLHLKYRPTTLGEVVGQKHIIKSLVSIIAGKSSHAFLLTGPSGVGKTTIARIVANDLGATGADGILEIDAATNSGVDSMRDIVSLSIYRPLRSESRAIIVDECHSLSKQAWQSILKAVEEPADFCYWFFCTTEAGKVPVTIKTRSTSMELRRINTDDIFNQLAKICELEHIKTPDVVLDVIAQFADGSLRAALVGLAQVASMVDPKEAAETLKFSQADDNVIDFIRYLVSGQNINWAEAMRRLEKLGEFDAESLRISISNYLAAVLKSCQNDQQICNLLRLLAAFRAPYDQSTSRAGLMLSLGLIIYEVK